MPDPDDLPLLLGDVVICPAVAAGNAPDHAGTFDDELALLVVHGILHVLGLDHADDAERVAPCRRASASCSSSFHGEPARDPWATVVIAVTPPWCSPRSPGPTRP